MASGIHKIKRQKGKILQTQFYYPVQSNNNLPKRSARDHFLYASSVYGVWIREA